MAKKELLDFLFESGMLKRTPRSGWLTIGIQNPESVAEHTYRTCVVGLALSRMEGLGKEQERLVLLGCLLHDMCETRLSDLNKINKKYLDAPVPSGSKAMAGGSGAKHASTLKAAKAKSFEGIFGHAGIAGSMLSDLEKASNDSLVSSVISDADKLEMALSAREYEFLGNKHARKWIESAKEGLKTASAKKIISQIQRADPYKWAFES